jgi:restriction system protein
MIYIYAMTDISFQYPPELLNLLVDTIPLLCRTKRDVLLFFRGAGVPEAGLAGPRQRLKETPTEINKFEIARSVLIYLSERGERTLRERREVLRRVVEFSNFDSCWPKDQLTAKGLVASVRDVVNQKDAFTRMNQAREEERQMRLAKEHEQGAARRERKAKIESAKAEFYSLFAENLSAQARGKMLEAALNNLFKAYGILIKEAFHLVGSDGEGIVEQIDGVIEVNGLLYFVEMKWYTTRIGVPEISQHLVRLMSRAEARGIFISASEYTDPAILTAREFLQHKIVVLANLRELVRLLEQQGDLAEFFTKKVQAAQIHKNPYFELLTS